MSPLTPGVLTTEIVGFCRFARGRGLTIGLQETLDALDAARLGTLTDRTTYRWALRALLCTSKEERDLFDDLFDAYWTRRRAHPHRQNHRRLAEPVTVAQQATPLLMVGAAGEDAPPEEEGKSTSGASALERLRTTDFSEVPPRDQERLEELAARLLKQMSRRLARRVKATRSARQIHLRRTIRQSIPHGGDPIELRYKGKKQRKPRLVVLLDVSGSMDAYSFFLLRFIYALQHHFERVESFVFSTRLTRITEAMNARRLPESLRALSTTAEAWSSGTRMGACLQDFNAAHARQALSRNALVLILSDGLDTGDPALLAGELLKIKRRAKKLIWLNPLLGMNDYQPLARGIQAALPLIDVFLSAHNLESLLLLETHLTDV